MEFKGTKGKWKIDNDCQNSIFITCDQPDWTICNTLSDFDQDKANALLISKAPEMLEMLGKCYEYFCNNTSAQSEENADSIGQLIREAIKFK